LNGGVQGGWRVWLRRKVRYLGQGSMIDVRLLPATLDDQKHRILSYQTEYQLGHYWYYCVFTSIQKTYIVCRYLFEFSQYLMVSLGRRSVTMEASEPPPRKCRLTVNG